MKLTPALAEEIAAKLDIVAETDELAEDYGITVAQAEKLAATVPIKGGDWDVPAWGVEVVKGELDNRADNLRSIAGDIEVWGEVNQARRCRRMAKQLENLLRELKEN